MNLIHIHKSPVENFTLPSCRHQRAHSMKRQSGQYEMNENTWVLVGLQAESAGLHVSRPGIPRHYSVPLTAYLHLEALEEKKF